MRVDVLCLIIFGIRNILEENSFFKRTFQEAIKQRKSHWIIQFCSGEWNFHSSVIFSLFTAAYLNWEFS